MNILELSKFGVAFGERIILHSVDLAIPERGVFTLLGPCGTGKSTLLRTICGINNAVASHRTWGDARYCGEPLGNAMFASLVSQNIRLITASVSENILNELPEKNQLTQREKQDLAQRLLIQAGLGELVDQLDCPVVELPIPTQRHLSIARAAAGKPRLLCIDEPTADLDAAQAEHLLQYIARLGQDMAVLLVLHNQQQARNYSDTTALLAGGWIQECNNTQDFFKTPQSDVTKGFIRTGSCSVPSPNAKPEDLDSDTHYPESPEIPAKAYDYVSDSFGPRGFLWLKRGLLAGTPVPGIVAEEDYDLNALKRVGIKVLVSLTEQRFPEEKLKEYGIRGLWLAIPDMHAPQLDETLFMVRQVAGCMQRGEAVAYHCKAGLGRTGTLLAAQLVLEGSNALEALDVVRGIEPRWVQSEAQVAFIERFADFLQQNYQRTQGLTHT